MSCAPYWNWNVMASSGGSTCNEQETEISLWQDFLRLALLAVTVYG